MRFFVGITTILLVYILAAWGISTAFQFSRDHICGFYYAGILATINVVLAFLVIVFTIDKDQKLFARVFLGSMAIRILLILIGIYIILNFTTVNIFVFVLSLFILHFLFQMWEVLVVNSFIKKE